MRKEEFEINLTRLQKSNPDHVMISVIEEMGYGALACEYLKMAMEEDDSEEEKTISIEALMRKKYHLYSKRAVHSNKFHTCTSDRERLEVSKAIGTIQTLIIDVKRQIECYYSTGQLPDVKKKSNLPIDGRRREKKLRSVRSSISYFRNKLMSENDPDKIKKYEQSIAEHQQTVDELSA